MKDLFMTVLRLCLSASIVLAAVLLLRLLFSKLRVPKVLSLCLWALVGLRLLIPTFPASSVSLVPQPVGSGQVVERVARLAVEETRTIREEEPAYQEILRRSPEIPVQREAAGQRYVVVSSQTLEAPKTVRTSILPVLAWSWLGGTLLMLGYMLLSFLKLRFKVRASIRQAENIYRCDELEAPFILGLIRPRIYLPSDLDPADEAYVLAHERAHLRRLDHIWKPLGFFLLSLYWFNPLFWLGYVLLCRDIEGACDEKVVKGETADYRKAYSLALVNCSMSRRLISACPLAFGETGVPGRVKSVLHYKKPAFWMLLAALLIGAITAGCALTNGKESSPGGSETAGQSGSGTGERTDNKEVYRSFVLFGEGTGNNPSLEKHAQGDVCIIVSIEKVSGMIRTASLRRDFLFEDASGQYCKLSDAYARYGAETVMAGLNRTMDLNITHYLALNWTALADATDMLGGIDLELSKAEAGTMNDYLFETIQATGRQSTLELDDAPGRKHLDGVHSVAYARLRDIADENDGRAERQQKLMAALWEGMQGLVRNVRMDTLAEIVDKVSQNSRTNMERSEILYFVTHATQYRISDTKRFSFNAHWCSALPWVCCSENYAEDVRELHRSLYPQEDYEPSEEVLRIAVLHKEYAQ